MERRSGTMGELFWSTTVRRGFLFVHSTITKLLNPMNSLSNQETSLRSLRTRTSRGGARGGRTTGSVSIPQTTLSRSLSSAEPTLTLRAVHLLVGFKIHCSDYATPP